MFLLIPILVLMLGFHVIGGLFRIGGSILGFFFKLILGVLVFGFFIYIIGIAALIIIPFLIISALSRSR